jgi:outer membrane protein OmpA-like peptidoglycan-associated protein
MAAKKPEEMSLWVENVFHTFVRSLKAPDMRNQSFDVQLENISGSINQLRQDHQYLLGESKTITSENDVLRSEVAKLQGQSQSERLAKQRLEDEKRFQEVYSNVSRFFSQKEAEVYREGDKLVVRLRGMTFPVGQYVIMPNNYSLLSKVQRAIRTFGKPNVVIEGHTDSTGPRAVNNHLSQMRAEAVRNYLVANKTLGRGNIQALGYGSKRPLTANTTKTGRALNRRIDVVIQPDRVKPAQ